MQMKLYFFLAMVLLAIVACTPSLAGETRMDGAEQLSSPENGASDQNPAFSPDGSKLVFTRFDNAYNVGPAGLFLLDIETKQASRLTPFEDQDNVNLPGSAWDTDSYRIVFASDREETDDLWQIASGGSGMGRITTHNGPPWHLEPSWSPDGEWLVFEASWAGDSEDGRVSQVWKIRQDGTTLTYLTSEVDCDDRQPNWSPAGDRIVFQRRALPDGKWDLFTLKADGSDLQNITNSPSIDETDASWSPGGKCLVYSTDNNSLSAPNLFIVRTDGGSSIRLTSSTTHEDSAPSWSPDKQWIAFESHPIEDPNSAATLWRIAVPQDVCGGEFSAYLPLTVTGIAPTLTTVNDFLYQLQNLNLQAIGDTAYDLIVIDYSAEGDDETAFSTAEIAALKNSPGGPKIVLAYMSIGEAENYRFYWQDWWEPGNPHWLDEKNPNCAGNYKVRYWEPEWQAIIVDYMNKLLTAGFDGAYLDIIDAYEYYAEQGRPTAAQEMVDFVAAIRTWARGWDPDFFIFPQNAPELAGLIPDYLQFVDGIGQEDIYYGYEEDDVMTPPAVTAELESHLDIFRAANKLVLTIDYAATPVHIDDAYAQSQAQNYVPFVTVRELDQLIINPDHEPD